MASNRRRGIADRKASTEAEILWVGLSRVAPLFGKCIREIMENMSPVPARTF